MKIKTKNGTITFDPNYNSSVDISYDELDALMVVIDMIVKHKDKYLNSYNEEAEHIEGLRLGASKKDWDYDDVGKAKAALCEYIRLDELVDLESFMKQQKEKSEE